MYVSINKTGIDSLTLVCYRCKCKMEIEDEEPNWIIETPNLKFEPDARGIGYAYFTQMREHQDKIVQIDVLTKEKDTFSSLLQRCIRTAITMRSKGITPNDIISLCTFDHLNSIVPFISTLFVGAKVASLDPALSLDDTIDFLKQVTPKMIFVIPDAVNLIETAIKSVSPNTEIVVFGETQKHTKFSDFLKPSDEEVNFEPTVPKSLKDTAIIIFSNETSDLPKGVCVNHFALLGQTENMMNLGLDFTNILAFASLYWTTSVILWSVTLIGGTTKLVVPKFDDNIAWEIILEYKPTYMLLAPNQILAMILTKPDFCKIDSLKDIFITGGLITKTGVSYSRKAFPGVRVGAAYGHIELVGFGSCFKANNRREVKLIPYKPSSVGTGMPGMTYKVVDIETEESVGPYQQGELRIKTELQMNGYYNMDASDAWDSDGWLKTGDIVYYDEDKYFYAIDRVKEMLKYQFWHVAPATIENVILAHPAVETAVVIGIPHDTDGHHPMAVVKPHDECCDEVTPQDIATFVEENLDDTRRLRGGVKFVDFIPTFLSGNVRRREVKNMFLPK